MSNYYVKYTIFWKSNVVQSMGLKYDNNH